MQRAPATPASIIRGDSPYKLQWRCPPASCAATGHGDLRIETQPGTDAWQRTHYGFRADNAHFYYTTIDGDFVAATTVLFYPNAQYDQAGLMVRLSESCWLKASVEYEGPDRPARLGAVVTNCGFSDWSTVDFPAGVTELHLRVRREGSDYVVEASLPAAHAAATNAVAAAPPLEQAGDTAKHAVARAPWTQLRVAHLVEDAAPWGVAAAQEGARGAVSAPVDVGVYACSPRGQGFWACFKHLMLVKACAADA